MIETGESAFNKNRFRNDGGESHKHSKFERWNINEHKKARKKVDEADERVRSAEMKLDPTGTLSEMNPVHIARMKKGKAKRKAVGQLALNILFPFAPIMRAIKGRKKKKKHASQSSIASLALPLNQRYIQVLTSNKIGLPNKPSKADAITAIDNSNHIDMDMKKALKQLVTTFGDDGVVRVYDNDSGMIAEENNYY